MLVAWSTKTMPRPGSRSAKRLPVFERLQMMMIRNPGRRVVWAVSNGCQQRVNFASQMARATVIVRNSRILLSLERSFCEQRCNRKAILRRAMATLGLIEYNDANAEVRAVYDDIMATRKTDRINNFWKAIANDPATLKRTWE